MRHQAHELVVLPVKQEIVQSYTPDPWEGLDHASATNLSDQILEERSEKQQNKK